MSDTRRGGADIMRVNESSADPAAQADRVLVYAKDVFGITQLFARSSDGSIMQLSAAGGGGSSIGGSIGGGPTDGSILFVGSGGVLAQDNSNLFWDGALHRLGIGNATPATTLDVGGSGTAAAVALRAGSTAAVSAGSTGRFRYNESTQKMQVSNNGAAYADVASGSGMAIGSTVTSGTTGSILFVGSSSTLAQANAAFNYDSSKIRLNIVQTGADPADGGGAITIQNTSATSLAQMTWRDSSGTFRNALGLSNTSGHAYFYTGASTPLEINLNNGSIAHLFDSDGGFQIGASTSAVGALSTGRFKYVSSGQKFQVSANGAAYLDMALMAAALTTGSVPFADSSGHLAQNNANFFFSDSTQKTLHVGTSGITTRLEVGGDTGLTTNAQNAFCIQPFTDGDVYIDSKTFTGGTTHFRCGAGAQTGSNLTWLNITNSTGRAVLPQGLLSLTGVDTSGSMLFVNSSANIAQDNANLFWDATNKRLGIGVNSSLGNALTVFDATVGGSPISIKSTVTSGYASIDFINSAGVEKGAVGYGNSATGNSVQSLNFFYCPSVDWVMSDTTVNWFRWYTTTNSVGFEMTNGSSAAASLANTGKLIYTPTGQKFQISANTSAYQDVVLLGTFNTFTKAQVTASFALTDAASITTDASLSNVFTVTLGGNRTLANPTNLVSGATYAWVVSQDATGTRTLAYGNAFTWPGGITPVLSTAINAVDVITSVYDGTKLRSTISKAFS